MAKYSQSIVYCSIGDTSLRDFYIMTLIGGNTDGPPIASTFYYEHQGDRWVNGPNLIQARQYHAAGIVTDEMTKEKLVIGPHFLC